MNRNNFLLGIDVGTQSTRVALIEARGRVAAVHSRPNTLVTPQPGWGEEDPQEWWLGVVEGVQAVLAEAHVQPTEVLAIGCDSLMHATVPIDQEGNLLSHAVQIWCDKRGADLVAEFKGRSECPRAMRLAGSPPTVAWIGFKIQWLKRYQPTLYGYTWQFLTGAGYINYCLTGVPAIDWSEASGTFLMDAGLECWSEELGNYLEIDLEKLPAIYPSSQVIGRVNRQAAALTGLCEGTPVVAGGGDMLCMLLAAGVTEPGMALDVGGSAADLVVYVGKPVTDPPVMNLHHVLQGWTPFGIADAGAISLKWFKDEFCQGEINQARVEKRDVYDILNEKAAQISPGSEGVLYLPYLLGERALGSPNARGVFFGLTLRSNTAVLVRAVMEGITYELKRTLEIVERAGNPVVRVYTSGGGARSRLWCQIKADIYGKPVYKLAETEGGVIGAALLAGLGCGVYADAVSGSRLFTQVEEIFQPIQENQARYEKLYGLFKELHDGLQSSFQRLGEIS